MLDVYDFIVYAVMSRYISDVFFPNEDSMTSLISTFAIFAIGYLARPVGGIIFGHLGDKYGRVKLFSYSILLMAFSTFFIGLIPSYTSIGIYSTLLITFFRLLQGLALGGEFPGAITYITEFSVEKSGKNAGYMFCSMWLGAVLGSLTLSVLLLKFTHPEMLQFGWRIPFFISGVLGLFGFFIRTRLIESPDFSMVKRIERVPLWIVLRNKKVDVLVGIFVVAINSATFYSLWFFLPDYLVKIVGETKPYLHWYITLGLLLSSLFCVPFGYLADRLSISRFVRLVCLLAILLPFPIYSLYMIKGNIFIASVVLSAVLSAISAVVIPKFLFRLFATNIRYTGISICYNFANAIFGGFAPMASLLLIKESGSNMAPPVYIIGLGVVALIATTIFYRVSNRVINRTKTT